MAELPPVDFRDVEDPHAFVWGWIHDFQSPKSHRGPIALSADEREELHAEGMLILCKLARDYVPQMEGYEQEGCFSGYAAWAGPKKLGDVWHRLHEEHQLVTQPDGKRRWRYGDAAASLEAVMEEDGDRSMLLATKPGTIALERTLRRALTEYMDQQVDLARVVRYLQRKGYGKERIAEEIHTTVDIVDDRLRAIAAVQDYQIAWGLSTADALIERARPQIEFAVLVGCKLGEGSSPSDIAAELEVDGGLVRDAMLLIGRVRDRLESE